MIQSKLRAYNFKDGEWETVTRWQLIHMSELEYKKFKEHNFPLYLKKDHSSYKLTFNQRQKTFRFYPGQIPDDKKGSSGLTIAHQLAQEVISNLRTLHLKLTDKRFKPYKKVDIDIEADQIFEEHRTTANDNEYIVDLLVLFSKPAWLALKWNRILILEVYVTNELRGQKIIDFEKKGLSMAEVVIGSKLKIKKTASEVSEREEDQLRNIMKHAFSKQIYGDLWIDTSTSKYLENEVLKEREGQITALKQRVQISQDKINVLNEGLELKDQQLRETQRNLKTFDLALQKEASQKTCLKKELNHWESKSKFQRLLDLLRK